MEEIASGKCVTGNRFASSFVFQLGRFKIITKCNKWREMCNMLFSVLVRCDLQKGSDASLNTTLVVLASRPLKILEYETKGHIKGKKEKNMN